MQMFINICILLLYKNDIWRKVSSDDVSVSLSISMFDYDVSTTLIEFEIKYGFVWN